MNVNQQTIDKIASILCSTPGNFLQMNSDIFKTLYFRQLSGLWIRIGDAGCLINIGSGRIGLGEKSPPQFGQILFSFVSTQSRQKVHS
jgi:hypothetical protein